MFKDFLCELTKDLRRESNQSFLFEVISLDYEAKMIKIFNKAIKDEVQAAVIYKAMAEKIIGPGANNIKKELEAHAQEEFDHFNKVVAYAANHGILDQLVFENAIDFQSLPNDTQGIVQFIQKLEKDAIKDYSQASKLADSEGDTETRMFFEGLMQDEMTHFDDIADLDVKSTRKFNEF